MTMVTVGSPGSILSPDVPEPPIERPTMRAVSARLLPFLFVLYIFNYLDRTNVSMAALQMNKELNFSSAAFGFGAGIFFIGYALCEIPSNLILARVGARRWIARIMVSWGLIACAMALVRTPHQFYVLRFLLGVAEAGFAPGVIYYLSGWFPAAYRARALAAFFIAIPLSSTVSGSVGGFLLGLGGVAHLSGWKWLFLVEGLPSIILGFVVLRYLTNRPEDAHWLSPAQREWLSGRLDQERQGVVTSHGSPLLAIANPLVWLLSVPWFAVYVIGIGYLLWAPTLIRDVLGTNNTTTGLVIGGIQLVAAFVYLLTGMMSDRSGDRCGFAAVGLGLGCVGCLGMALLPHSPLRVAALAFISLETPVVMPAFWCLPTKLLKGPAAATGIAFINSMGALGGFFGPNIIGFFKQTTGSDSGAFFGFAGLAFVSLLVCVGLRQVAVFRPKRAAVRSPAMQPA